MNFSLSDALFIFTSDSYLMALARGSSTTISLRRCVWPILATLKVLSSISFRFANHIFPMGPLVRFSHECQTLATRFSPSHYASFMQRATKVYRLQPP